MALQSTISVVTCIAVGVAAAAAGATLCSPCCAAIPFSIQIIIFTTDLFCSWSLFAKTVLFVGAEHLLLFAKSAVSSAAESVNWVNDLNERHNMITSKVFKGVIHEEDSDEDPDAEVRADRVHHGTPNFSRLTRMCDS